MLFDRLFVETWRARAESVAILGDRAAELRLPLPAATIDWPADVSAMVSRHRMVTHCGPPRCCGTGRRFQRLMHGALLDCSERLPTHHPSSAYLGFLFSVETCRLWDRVSSSSKQPALLSLRELYRTAEPYVEDEEKLRAYAFLTLDLIRSCAVAADTIVRGMGPANAAVPSNDRW